MPQRLAPIVAPVCLVGLGSVLAAAVSFASKEHPASMLLGVAALLIASTLASRYPVPIEGPNSGGVSLSFVFAASAIVLFGWDAGVLVAFAAPVLIQLIEHRPPIRIAYNGSVFAFAAAVGGLLVSRIGGDGTDALIAKVAISASTQYGINLVLISLVVASTSRRPFFGLIQASLRWTIMIFALMASAALVLVVLWQRSPMLSAALVGPLLAIALYQRSTYRALRAMRLALTDPLTGLGNHRHFHERLERELIEAERNECDFSLCLVDVDDFKRVNDLFGHPAGDRVLSHLATSLRQNGEAFRLGGDEFALLLPEYNESESVAAAEAIIERIGSLGLDHVGSVTVSAGVATFPRQAPDRGELIRLADSALYWAKENGKNRVHVYRPDVVELAELRRLAVGPDRAARFRAAASLAKAVDLRDTYTGSHSARVAELAARVAAKLGLDQEHIELSRLAGSLHDLGKLAIPEEILRKPGPLTGPERLVLERHPQIGFRMLDSLGIDPVADWILHHHERWDGTGYPDRMPGPEIPLGARIIFVVDAYDAMTSDRVYRGRLSQADALAELERCAGTQFDPAVVAALAEELEAALEDAPAQAALAS
ncbi:MAG: diguanylate cyclase [Actinobacteria bacterium]|nr:MAG: diguanylate cyclase [Actinomycetota bacterium]